MEMGIKLETDILSQRYIQTESLGPVPISLCCFSGQNYSHLQHELGGGGAAAICQLQDVTLMPAYTTSHWTLVLASPFFHLVCVLPKQAPTSPFRTPSLTPI